MPGSTTMARYPDQRTRAEVNAMSEAAAPAADIPPFRYTAALAAEIEHRWQDFWEREGTFHAPNPAGPLADPDHPRAGAEKRSSWTCSRTPRAPGLHVGHPLGYIATDVLRPLPADGRPQRAAHHGLRRLRPARRAVRGADRHPPARPPPRPTSSGTRAPAAPAGPGPRQAALGGHHRHRTSTGGPSGSSCRSSTPGTTRRRTGPARSPS